MTPAPGADNESFADAAFTAAADAYMAVPGSWAEAIHATLGALLAFLAESPEDTRRCVEASLRGPAALDRRDRTLDRFTQFLEPGYAEGQRQPPAVVGEAIVGGVYELVRTYAQGGRGEAISDALPAATVVVLAPFVGDHEAARLAARPISVRAHR